MRFAKLLQVVIVTCGVSLLAIWSSGFGLEIAQSKILDRISEMAYPVADNHSAVVNDFEHQPRVAIVSKTHGPDHFQHLAQSLCLLHAAYNRRVLYDIIVFSTLPYSEEQMDVLRQVVSPASITLHIDKQTLQEQLAELAPHQLKRLISTCENVSSVEDFTWQTWCVNGWLKNQLQYSWMSEFRSKQLWLQEALKPYQYMIWFDSDSFPTQVWQQDPVAFMIRNDLVLLIANFPSIMPGHTGVQKRIHAVYNKTLCSIGIGEDARMNTTYTKNGESCWDANVRKVHGFFHLTNLDFYRQPQNIHWSNVMVGDEKFGRVWDDQLNVVVPPAMLAPHRAMDMETAGLMLEVMHNGYVMGKRKYKGGAYLMYHRREGAEKFPEAHETCSALVVVPMR